MASASRSRSASSSQTWSKPERASASTVRSTPPATSCGRYPTVTPLSRGTRPSPGSSTPPRMRQRVVLPAPLGPTRPIRSPRPTRHEQSWRSAWPPYPLETDSRAITACGSLAHGLDALGHDLVDHTLLARLPVGVLLHA